MPAPHGGVFAGSTAPPSGAASPATPKISPMMRDLTSGILDFCNVGVKSNWMVLQPQHVGVRRFSVHSGSGECFLGKFEAVKWSAKLCKSSRSIHGLYPVRALVRTASRPGSIGYPRSGGHASERVRAHLVGMAAAQAAGQLVAGGTPISFQPRTL